MNAPHGNASQFCADFRLAEPQLPGLTNPGALSYSHVEGEFAATCHAADNYVTYTAPDPFRPAAKPANHRVSVRAFLQVLARRYGNGNREIALKIADVLAVWNALHGQQHSPNQFAAQIKNAALGGELAAPGGAILEHRKRNGRMVWLLRPELLHQTAASRRGASLARKTKRELLGLVRAMLTEATA